MNNYTTALLGTLADESKKYSLDSRMKQSKRNKLIRIIKCLQFAIPAKRAPMNSSVVVQSADNVEYHEYTLLSIDALRDECGGWSWNDMHKIEEGIMIAEDSDIMGNSRKLLKWMRDQDWLNEASKGKVKIDFGDLDVIEIQNKNTGEPFLALSCVHG